MADGIAEIHAAPPQYESSLWVNFGFQHLISAEDVLFCGQQQTYRHFQDFILS